jgi:hypothetical protein|tara:strand:+ start:12515 stop:13507 length:993 start_codon:yes stop_codon:yes gene_type:complete
VFDEVIEYAESLLNKDGKEYNVNDVLDKAVGLFLDSSRANEKAQIAQHGANHQSFIERNLARWEGGFDKLDLFYITAQEAGVVFQENFTSIPDLENDPLLGVLMRQHAHACRITSEIIHLLKGGYADGALARWRTLFEISVNCLIINKHGKDAAIDFVRNGQIKNVEGIEEYQKTAQDMNLEPYSDEYLNQALALKAELAGDEKSFHWARKYANGSKIEKLREYIGLGAWSHNYKLASRNIHADYTEMRSLLGMSEASEEVLLVGQSNSGITYPAHLTVISLLQITASFVTAYINEETEIDYQNSMFFLVLLKRYADEVGEAFLECQSTE